MVTVNCELNDTAADGAQVVTVLIRLRLRHTVLQSVGSFTVSSFSGFSFSLITVSLPAQSIHPLFFIPSFKFLLFVPSFRHTHLPLTFFLNSFHPKVHSFIRFFPASPTSLTLMFSFTFHQLLPSLKQLI